MPSVCLINMNARIYDPQIGRFQSADSIIPDTYNGQSLNRFSYVENNPLNAIDPSGHAGGDCEFASPATCEGIKLYGGLDQPVYYHGADWLGIGGGIAGTLPGGIFGGGWAGAGGFGGASGGFQQGSNNGITYVTSSQIVGQANYFGETVIGYLSALPMFVPYLALDFLDTNGAWAFGSGDVYIVYPNGAVEHRFGGSLNWRDNNPGNLRSGAFATRHGAIGTNDSASGPFAIFPNTQAGWAALDALLQNNYGNSTLSQLLSAYAPPNENDTAAYISKVAGALNVSPDTVVNTLNQDQLDTLDAAILRQEGWSVGNTTTLPP